VTRRFVPLRMTGKGDLAKQCAIRTLDFVEPGLVFLTPDLKMVHKVDRLSTFNEEWFVALLRGVLAKNKAYAKPPKEKADAEELLKRGDYEEALAAADSPYLKARIYRRLRKLAEAEEQLKAAPASEEVACERALLLMKQGKWAEALEAFAAVKGGDRTPEARFYQGAMLHHLNRDPEGRDVWKKLVEEPKSPWAWKAAAELAGKGTVFRGLEELAWTPDAPSEIPTTSIQPRAAKDKDLVIKRSVAYLLRTQRAGGAWTDSVYVFGGQDSIPNVFVAGTAIACTALLAWKEIDPKGVQAALDRAWPYLLDEKNTAPDDADEILWAHTYRISYLARLAAAEKEKKADCVKKIQELVAKLAKLQKRTGIWQHEYDNPFATASTLHVLWEAKQAGAEIPDDAVKRGTEALASCRTAKGIFSYDYPGGGAPVEMAAGRMPYCELALLLCGRSTDANLRAAVAVSFDRHALLERVRKYDNHADQWQNGGFFFWYDMVGRAEAIRRLKEGRDAHLARQRDLVLSITEIDGCFIDTHELGKSYGTAMGLITLKLCQ